LRLARRLHLLRRVRLRAGQISIMDESRFNCLWPRSRFGKNCRKPRLPRCGRTVPDAH